MSNEHDDFAVEPVAGLPSLPPKGEVLLWQGSPTPWALAREALKINWIAGYFVALAVWQGWSMGGGAPMAMLAVMLPYLVIGLLTCSILFAIAYFQARSTVYTITSSRVAMRIGVALTVTLNLPFRQIGSANLKLTSNGGGTIALQTLGDTRLSYLVCWPHVRPWHINRTQPALRAIPNAAQVAQILADAAETRISTPEVSLSPAHAMAAE